MSPCDDVRQRIMDALDRRERELPASCGPHLESCPDCRLFWEGLNVIESRWQLPAGVRTPDLTAGVMARVRSAGRAGVDDLRALLVVQWLGLVPLGLVACLVVGSWGTVAPVARDTALALGEWLAGLVDAVTGVAMACADLAASVAAGSGGSPWLNEQTALLALGVPAGILLALGLSALAERSGTWTGSGRRG